MTDDELWDAFNEGMYRDRDSLTPDGVRLSGLRAVAVAAVCENGIPVIAITGKPEDTT